MMPLIGEALSTTPAPLVGAHMPTAGGHHNALLDGKAIGCRAVQIFTASPRQWKAAPIKPETVTLWQEALKEAGILVTVAHDSYLINLAAPEGSDVLIKSRTAFRAEIERAEALGINYLVSHPGAHTGDGVDVGIARIIRSLDVLHQETAGAKVQVALETTAGQGTYLGGTFEQLARILEGVQDPDRLVVCLDTCHVFAAGYDLRTADTYAHTMADFERVVGREKLKVVHANDSVGTLGSHLDRHAHIGDGEIGLEGFRSLMNDPRMAGLPVLVETPESETMHAQNVLRLASLFAG